MSPKSFQGHITHISTRSSRFVIGTGSLCQILCGQTDTHTRTASTSCNILLRRFAGAQGISTREVYRCKLL